MIVQTIASIIPEFDPSDWLTPEGLKALTLYTDLSGCQSMRSTLLSDPNITYVKPNWTQSWVFGTFNDLVANGGRPFVGPLLVLQGNNDPAVSYDATTAAVNATCDAFKDADLQYVVFEGVTHVPGEWSMQSPMNSNAYSCNYSTIRRPANLPQLDRRPVRGSRNGV